MSIREIINSLIACNQATIAYYNHEPQYLHCNPVETDLKGYDGGDDFYSEYEPVLTMFGSGDYVGNDIDMSNMRYVEENYPELFEHGSITYNNSGYGYSELVIFFLRPSVIRSGLFDDLEELDDYPLLDDETNSKVQEELLEEAWESWGQSEWEREIKKRTDIDFTETDWQDSLFWELLRNGNGGGYYPEGTSMWIDFKEILKDQEDVIQLIIEHADSLDSGEFEIVGEWRTVGKRLGFDTRYTGDSSWETRQTVLDTHVNKKPMLDETLETYGLTWYDVDKICWEVKPTNEKVKECLGNRPIDLIPIRSNDEYCENCYRTAVCRVLTERGFINDNHPLYTFCDDCYNLLMNYWPKCEHCQTKNVNASLQLSLFPGHEDSPQTHCQDCKNSLLTV